MRFINLFSAVVTNTAGMLRLRRNIKNEEKLAELFKKYDEDGTNQLPPEQLLPLLREVAPPPFKHADEADAAFVVARADADGSGAIEITELKFAVATWREVAQVVAPANEGSSTCVLL